MGPSLPPSPSRPSQVDLGGVCSSGSWAHPVASAAGWVDNFLDRILMSVHLLRDEVEQRRFIVQPFKLVESAKARLNEVGRRGRRWWRAVGVFLKN